jgi:hypothetical protein
MKLAKNMDLLGKNNRNIYFSWRKQNNFGSHSLKVRQLTKKRKNWSRKSWRRIRRRTCNKKRSSKCGKSLRSRTKRERRKKKKRGDNSMS